MAYLDTVLERSYSGHVEGFCDVDYQWMMMEIYSTKKLGFTILDFSTLGGQCRFDIQLRFYQICPSSVSYIYITIRYLAK